MAPYPEVERLRTYVSADRHSYDQLAYDSHPYPDAVHSLSSKIFLIPSETCAASNVSNSDFIGYLYDRSETFRRLSNAADISSLELPWALSFRYHQPLELIGEQFELIRELTAALIHVVEPLVSNLPRMTREYCGLVALELGQPAEQIEQLLRPPSYDSIFGEPGPAISR